MEKTVLDLSPDITVTVHGRPYSTSRGTRIKNFLRRYFPEQEPRCMGAILDNRLVHIEAPIADDCELIPVTYDDSHGVRIYRSTLSIMLGEAVARLFPEAEVRIGQSFGRSYYYDVIKEGGVSHEELATIETEMRAMVVRNEALHVERVPRRTAVRMFTAAGRRHSADLLRVLVRKWVPLVSMGKRFDLCLNTVTPTAGYIRQFRLDPLGPGLVVNIPHRSRPDSEPEPVICPPSLYKSFRETRKWNSLVGVESVSDLNNAIVDGSIGEVIRVSEALHERKLAEIADEVARRDTRLVVVAGPSSSGKTTTVRRLSMQLKALGLKPKAISLDNYYKNRADTPKDEDGELDFEHIEAIDLDLLNEHLHALLQGRTVQSPTFSFQSGIRNAVTTPVSLAKDEILLVEGIHGLNDRLTRAVHDDQKYRLFCSAATQLCIDDQHRVFTTDIRLIRRIVRDRHFRGYSAADTLRLWPRVRAGEKKWIFPWQDRADMFFNTTLVYEPAVLKIFAERFLVEVPDTDPVWVEAERLLKFLRFFIPVFTDDVPGTSIIREFVGESSFRY